MNVTPQEAREMRRVFFVQIFGAGRGYFCLSSMKRSLGHKSWRDEFFRYPEETDNILDRIEEFTDSSLEAYFSPMLYDSKTRKKESVSYTPVAYSDLDFCSPDDVDVKPSIAVESSPARYQAYWVLEKAIDPDDLENLNKRIAYKHAEQGADRTGWDLSQALRVPYTYNYKHTDAYIRVIDINKRRYRLSDFEDAYPLLPDYEYVDEPLPDMGALPDGDELLQARRLEINPGIWKLYNEEPAEDWSRPLWNLQMLLFEAGFTREEVFVIVQEAKCNKYRRDGKPLQLLWKEVCRASLRSEQNELALKQETESHAEKVKLLSAEEREIILRADETFIERYVDWAKELGDAAVQYHQAGAFVALSSLLAGRVKLPTSFGTIIPNLWFMILADTTLTRKTTAMDIAMDMITEIDDEIVLATDGSIEGLLTALSTRPGRPGVFLRDEFSGLLEQMTRKDYMAGMPELLTKLYDGKMQKRILRKETIEVKDPVLIVFAGGIKNKVTSILTTEQVSSGFMPRFVFITAESDISKLKPIGPPTQRTVNNGESIRVELQDIYDHYHHDTTLTIEKLKQKYNGGPQYFSAKLTDDAWVRYNQLEYTMLELGLASGRPEIMTPTYDRLSKSILKAAVLLAASVQRDDEVTVTLEHILRAIYYGESWKTYVEDIMENIGKTQTERLLDAILRTVQNRPGIGRSQVMQNHHLSAWDCDRAFATLEQRGLILRHKVGKTETLTPSVSKPRGDLHVRIPQ